MKKKDEQTQQAFYCDWSIEEDDSMNNTDSANNNHTDLDASQHSEGSDEENIQANAKSIEEGETNLQLF